MLTTILFYLEKLWLLTTSIFAIVERVLLLLLVLHLQFAIDWLHFFFLGSYIMLEKIVFIRGNIRILPIVLLECRLRFLLLKFSGPARYTQRLYYKVFISWIYLSGVDTFKNRWKYFLMAFVIVKKLFLFAYRCILLVDVLPCWAQSYISLYSLLSFSSSFRNVRSLSGTRFLFILLC